MALPKDIEKIKKQATVFVIFGATGDLSRKKLFPALFTLFQSGLLPEKLKIIAASRTKHSTSQFQNSIKESVNPQDSKKWQDFAKKIEFIASDVAENKNLENIAHRLSEIEKETKSCIKAIIYLAVAPTIYEDAFENIGKNKLNFGCLVHKNKSRVVIEKPFGYDFASAQRLNALITRFFEKEQIFRIDHFLGKETVQNILAFRFGNEIFEPLLNSQYVDNIQITFTEYGGIGKRGPFYDNTGALRDVVQNHLFQLLAIATMEEPQSFGHEDFRKSRLEIIGSIKKIEKEDVEKYTVRGQYEGYRNEEKVDPKSQTETYALVKFFLENKRWQNVPIYIRTGKKMAGDVASIIYSFKERKHNVFENFWQNPMPNHITIQIKPAEGIGIRLVAKKPGMTTQLEPVDMEFCYKRSFDTPQPEAYERLLMDVILGDQTLFIGEVGASWKVIDPIREAWDAGKPPLAFYKPGSWGPQEADQFMMREGHVWLAPYLTICKI